MTPPAPGTSDTPVKRRCHRCHGSGRAPCQICNGSGQVLIGTDGQGKPRFDRCSGCFGVRTKRCTACGGEGFMPS